MSIDFDVCVIGSGAGGGPVAMTLAEAGYSVVVLEKGPWYREEDFPKDEIAQCRRHMFTPSLHDEPQVVEVRGRDGDWAAYPTRDSGYDFWNASCVGGATNLMSGFFHRLKPVDFRLRAAFGPVEGADVRDWPISYDTLEPYYDLVERVVGVSGQVVDHPHAEARSSRDFPLEPTLEHPVAQWIEEGCRAIGAQAFAVPRAILTRAAGDRRPCEYSGYCGSYGCSTGAKGSSRAALLQRALATGRCEIRPHTMARKIETDQSGRATAVIFHDTESGRLGRLGARVFVVAGQAIESARLLLMSTGPRHPHGLGNHSGQLGRNLLFSTAAKGFGDLVYSSLDPERANALRSSAPFINRAVQDWYEYDDPETGRRTKGGTLDFLFLHPNPISRALDMAWASEGRLWGWALKRKLIRRFTTLRTLSVEVFADWMPTPDCFVTLDPVVKDRWGLPVARVRVGRHPRNKAVSRFLADRGAEILKTVGAEDVWTRAHGSPATNLQAGGCRFGDDPETSVLDRDCRVHSAENVFVSDGSFMPTGGSVPYTWTIYANAFRVADHIVSAL